MRPDWSRRRPYPPRNGAYVDEARTRFGRPHPSFTSLSAFLSDSPTPERCEAARHSSTEGRPARLEEIVQSDRWAFLSQIAAGDLDVAVLGQLPAAHLALGDLLKPCPVQVIVLDAGEASDIPRLQEIEKAARLGT
jgi:hypothetical protein